VAVRRLDACPGSGVLGGASPGSPVGR